MSKTQKYAIVLFNLGGPDKQEAVGRFLFNLFYDPFIVSLSNPFRWLLAHLISRRRCSYAQGNYARIGGSSPLLRGTGEQASALEKALTGRLPDTDVSVFVCMRYWHPMTEEVVAQVRNSSPDRVFLLPLYPQYSASTTGSSLRVWWKAVSCPEMRSRTQVLCCYPDHDAFVGFQTSSIRSALRKSRRSGKHMRILFSAHGLPQRSIRLGDPYRSQVMESVAAVCKSLRESGEENFSSVVCYQSRIGPVAWTGPSTREEIERAARDGVGIVLVPVAFVSEHVETLVELDIEYKELADSLGVAPWIRIPTASTDAHFISGLASMVVDAAEKEAGKIYTCRLRGICDSRWKRCAQRYPPVMGGLDAAGAMDDART